MACGKRRRNSVSENDDPMDYLSPFVTTFPI
jgi:hypothetical protein